MPVPLCLYFGRYRGLHLLVPENQKMQISSLLFLFLCGLPVYLLHFWLENNKIRYTKQLDFIVFSVVMGFCYRSSLFSCDYFDN